MNVYIRIEVLARELQGRLLLALAAAERGHHVLLGKFKYGLFDADRIPELPVGIFHDNSAGSDAGGKSELHWDLVRRGFLVTGQDEEHGLAGPEDFAVHMEGRFPPRAMDAKAAMFAFGPFDADGIRALAPGHTHIVQMTGSPRVDLWRPDLQAYRALRPSPLGDPARRYVLWVMSWSPFFTHEEPLMDFGRSDTPVHVLLDRLADLEHSGLDEETTAVYRTTVRTIETIRELSSAFPDVTFVHRPHPSERPGVWEDLLAGLHNVVVRSDNAVTPWLTHAACVVFSGSTVGLEAQISGRPTISYQPAGTDLMPAANRMGARATNVTELAAGISAALSGSFQVEPERRAAIDALIASRFAALDGPLAADRIVEHWESLATERVTGARPVRPTDVLPEAPSRTSLARLRGAAGRALALGREPRVAESAGPYDGGSPVWDRHETKFPSFDLAEVLDIQGRLTETLGRFSNVRIRPIHKRLLHVGPE